MDFHIGKIGCGDGVEDVVIHSFTEDNLRVFGALCKG